MDTKSDNGNNHLAPVDAERLLSQSLLLTRNEVAAILRTDPDSVDYMHRMKTLRAIRVGKENRWKPNAVRAYVEGLEPAE